MSLAYKSRIAPRTETVCVVAAATCFLIGAAAGVLFFFFGQADSRLCDELCSRLLAAARGVEDVWILSSLWHCVRWPLLILLAGASVAGAILIPMLLILRGFLLAYSAVAFGGWLGASGAASWMIVSAASVLFVIPCVFVISCECLRTSVVKLMRTGDDAGARFRSIAILLPAVVLTPVTILQHTVIPAVFSAVCARLFC